MKNILIPLAALSLVSCSLKHARFSDASRWMPKTFSPKTHVLLVERFPVAKMNDKMDAYLAKNYPGKYQILSTKMLSEKSVAYADADKYPFAFM